MEQLYDGIQVQFGGCSLDGRLTAAVVEKLRVLRGSEEFHWTPPSAFAALDASSWAGISRMCTGIHTALEIEGEFQAS